jgi:hypothetical protein
MLQCDEGEVGRSYRGPCWAGFQSEVFLLYSSGVKDMVDGEDGWS